jgi:hypothetical protein
MTVDYRKLLKDCIRGMIIDCDIPAVPIASWHEDGEDSTREELELFFDLVAEVVSEQGELRQFVLDDIARLERNYLGDGGA